MPRSAAKGRRASSVQASPPPGSQPEAEDTIPGCPAQAQWMDMLNQEEADEIVGEIIDELLSKVMEGCLRVYIESQIAPFSTFWAKSYLIQILEQQFLCPDEGEGPEVASETEDMEPMPAISDAWAQGCVPVVSATPRPHPAEHQEADIIPVPVQTEQRVNQQRNVMMQANSPPKQCEKETSPRGPVSDKPCKGLSPHPLPKIDRKKKQQVNLPPKPVQGKLPPVLSCSAEKMDVEVEGKKRVYSVYNPMTGLLFESTDYKHIPRLDHSRLPRHCILPQYEIVDSNYAKPNSKKPSGRSKLEPKCNEQQNEQTLTTHTAPTSSKDQPAKFQRKETGVSLKKLSHSGQRGHRMEFSGPLRLDTMVLAKGVTLRDPQAVESTPLQFNPHSCPTKLRPIRTEVAVPLLSADQITTG